MFWSVWDATQRRTTWRTTSFTDVWQGPNHWPVPIDIYMYIYIPPHFIWNIWNHWQFHSMKPFLPTHEFHWISLWFHFSNPHQRFSSCQGDAIAPWSCCQWLPCDKLQWRAGSHPPVAFFFHKERLQFWASQIPLLSEMAFIYVIRKWYCWWKKSCTTCYLWNPMKNGILSISTGAGYLPSTVFMPPTMTLPWPLDVLLNRFNRVLQQLRCLRQMFQVPLQLLGCLI